MQGSAQNAAAQHLPVRLVSPYRRNGAIESSACSSQPGWGPSISHHRGASLPSRASARKRRDRGGMQRRSVSRTHCALGDYPCRTSSRARLHRRLLLARGREPDATLPLHFAPAEATQVDFGAGPAAEGSSHRARAAPPDNAMLRVISTWSWRSIRPWRPGSVVIAVCSSGSAASRLGNKVRAVSVAKAAQA
jgi:hypothetical protein